MMGEVDAFDFVLAKDLGKTLGQVRDIPHGEYVEWRAYYTYEHALRNPTKVL